ncbi:MAG: mechanosensitive ion channel [Parvibaculum sp.]|uniref:mechanosensitive ion channel family protein n=1 Tax=Parvibaculum sp. TaxID=2024848 RepID=UPI002728100A|nr:mechanosensitive ion channel domain-containing protein [Parvibaculum sp.]MDO8838379.1 mechanosensitive ion channel [Parvibaculum sp.]
MSADEEPVSPLPNLEDIIELITDSASQYLITWPVFVQLAALLVLLVVGMMSRRHFAPYVERLTTREPSGSVLSAPLARLHLVIPALAAAIVVWLAYGLVQSLGLRGDIFQVVATLLTAWVIIRLATSLIRQPGWASLVATVVWGIAALALLGLLGPFYVLLDSVAFSAGEFRISLLGIVNSIIVFGLFILAANFLIRLAEDRMARLEGVSAAARVLIVKILRIALVIAATIVALTSLGVDLTAIAIFSGAVGVGVGFGLQKVVSNLLSGILLLLDRSLKPGDVIEVGDAYGWIENMGARYITVATRDGKEYLIPNEDIITQQVINWSYSNRAIRIRIGVGISYRSDVRKAMDLMAEAATAQPRVLSDEAHKPQVRLIKFGDSSVDLELRIWVLDPEKGMMNVTSDIRLAIWDAFHANGVEFPFPQRDLHISSAKGLEDLAQRLEKAGDAGGPDPTDSGRSRN